MGVLFPRSQVTARHLIEARSTLESSAAELAASRAEYDEINYLRQALTDLEGTADVVEHARLDLAFHYGIVRAARNPIIQPMLTAVV